MDKFFDRLEEVIQSLLGEGRGADGKRGSRSAPRFDDPDMADAWEELDEYLRTGEDAHRQSHGSAGDRRGAYSGAASRRRDAREELRDDYRNLEVAFGASLDEVRRSYRRLMRAYHPDRFNGDSEKVRVATEISSRLNASFARIREFEDDAGRGT